MGCFYKFIKPKKANRNLSLKQITEELESSNSNITDREIISTLVQEVKQLKDKLKKITGE